MTLWPEVTFTEREKHIAKEVAIRIAIVAWTIAFFFGSCFDRDVGIATWFK